jgi:signal-transduction protein with cAMP-binding, CBS, and nucleotidyltransferase domain
MQSFGPDEIVFKEGSRGDDLYIIVKGSVRIFTRITENVEKTLTTLRNGGVFGELAVISEDYRSATAKTLTETDLILINQTEFENLLENQQTAGNKILNVLIRIIADRLKSTTELYWQAVDWGLSISGILDLNYAQLINHREKLTLTLNSGEKVSGILLKAEKNNFGSEFLLRVEDDRLVLVPYGAVSSIEFNKPASDDEKE